MNYRWAGGPGISIFDMFILLVVLVLIGTLIYSAWPDYHKANVMLYTCSGKLLHVWEGATDIKDGGRTFTQVDMVTPTYISGGVVVADPAITRLSKPKEDRRKQSDNKQN